jgi:hypothetical protein
LIARLRAQPEGSSTWITYDGRDAAAQAVARDLAAAFESAHWRVRSLSAARIALKPGLMLMAAAEPTQACQAVADAIQATGLPLTIGSGYREFAAERVRANPSYSELPSAELRSGSGFRTGGWPPAVGSPQAQSCDDSARGCVGHVRMCF